MTVLTREQFRDTLRSAQHDAPWSGFQKITEHDEALRAEVEKRREGACPTCGDEWFPPDGTVAHLKAEVERLTTERDEYRSRSEQVSARIMAVIEAAERWAEIPHPLDDDSALRRAVATYREAKP